MKKKPKKWEYGKQENGAGGGGGLNRMYFNAVGEVQPWLNDKKSSLLERRHGSVYFILVLASH